MLLIENVLSKPILEQISRERLPEGVLCRVIYPICDIGEKNANGRVYEDAVWDRVHEEKDLKEKLDNRALFGHAEHPEQTQSNLEKTSHVIFEMWKDNGQEWQKFDVLDTPTGRIVDCLFRAGCRVGCSTRAEGDLEECEDDEGNIYQRVIPESYKYVTTDFTADPSTFGAIPHNIQRNVVSEVEKELKNEKLNGTERQFAQLIFEAMKCQDSKCVVEGARKMAKKVGEKKTIESLIKEGTIKVGAKVKYGDKDAKVSKIEEGAVRLLVGVESPTSVNVDGDAAISVSPEGLITILPTEALSELGQKEPKEPEEVMEPVSEEPPRVEPGTADAIIIGEEPEAVEDEVPEGKNVRGKRDGTGPYKDSAQRSIHGDKGIRKMRGEECPFERKAMGPEDTIEVGDTIEIRNLEDSETVVEASKVTEVGTMIGDVDTEFHKVKTESGGDKWYEAEAYTFVKIGEKVEEGKKQPGAKVRHRGDVVFPAGSSKVTDDKDHFPINNANQARNALGRANQYSAAPKWYKGSLSALVKKVASVVKAKYPSIEVTKAAEKPGKESIEVGATIKFDQIVEGKLGVVLIGGAIDEPKDRKPKYFDTPEEASEYAARMNKQLSKGEKSYYGLKYKTAEGKVAKIEETGITIALDDGTTVSIEDPTAVNITVTAPAPAEEIEPVGPPEEEIEDMEAAGPLSVEDDIPEEELESKIAEMRYTVKENPKSGWDVWDIKRDEHVETWEKEENAIANADSMNKNIREAKLPTEGGVSDEVAAGNLLQDKEGNDWTVKEATDTGLTVTQPGSPGTEKYIAWGDVDDFGFTKVSETKVEEAKSVEKDGEWFVESPSGATLGGPYKSKIEADKRKKDVEFYAASKESKVNEEEENGWASLSDESLITAYNVFMKMADAGRAFDSKDVVAVFAQIKKRGLEDKVLGDKNQESKVDEIKIDEDEWNDLDSSKLNEVSLNEPAGFDSCVDRGGRVRTVSGEEEHGLESGEYVKYCFTDGKSYRSDVRKKESESKVDEQREEHPSGSIFHGDKVKVLRGSHKGEVGEVVDITTPEEDPEELPEGQFDVKMPDGKMIYLGWDDVELAESKSISTTAKEIKGLRVEEASTRAERDKAIELLEEITDEKKQLVKKVRKEKAFEIKILVNKIGKTLEAKEQEVDAVRAKLEEKAKLGADMNKQLEEQKNLVTKAEEQWNDVVAAATNRVNSMEESILDTKGKHQKNLSEAKDGYQKKLNSITKANEIKLEKAKEEIKERVKEEVTKEFIKCFIEFKLSETALIVDDNSQALLEECKSLGEVEELLDEIIDAGRRSALHSESITGIHVSKHKVADPETVEAEHQVKNALDGMNR